MAPDSPGHAMRSWFPASTVGRKTAGADDRSGEVTDPSAPEELARLNAELRARVEELETALHVAPMGIAIAHDPDCRRITLNSYMRELLGLPADQTASLSAPPDQPFTCTNDRDGKQVLPSALPMQIACTGVEVHDFEVDLVSGRGDTRKLLCYARPLFDGRSKVRGSVGAFLDITEDRRQRGAFHTLAENMPALVARFDRELRHVYINRNVRLATGLDEADYMGPGGAVETVTCITRDLTQQTELEREMRQKMDELSVLNRRKDEFLAMLAHELRNPLAPIRSSVDLLRLHAPKSLALTKARETIDRQVHHMARLVDDLLDVSRVTLGTIELRKETVTLADLIASAVEASRPLVEGKNHELCVSLPSFPVYFDGDIVRLGQVLQNLLNNALKYTPEGGRVWIKGERVDDGVVLSVKDTGIGIPAHVVPRVFDMFTRGDRELERAAGGLGVGLSVVRQLVELHGGTVSARSEGPDRGSEFVVRLPHCVRIDDVASSSPKSQRGARPGRRRILTVDDNKDAAESLADLLRLVGHDVHVAHDGRQAVASAAALRPDVILLDIALPYLDGYQVARRIREEPWGKNLFIIAITGWGQKDDMQRATDAGIDRHLLKPVALETLEGALAELERNRNGYS